MKRLKNSKEAGIYREQLLVEQNGLDPIIGTVITKPVLDHYHAENQHCRATLQLEVNTFEGKVFNAYNRFIKHLTDKELPEVLRELADYMEKYNSIPEEEQVIHHTALSIDTNRFKRMPSDVQKRILSDLGVEPDSNSTKRAKQARKLIRDGILDIKKHGQR